LAIIADAILAILQRRKSIKRKTIEHRRLQHQQATAYTHNQATQSLSKLHYLSKNP
jgi:hypothetical protein